MKYRDKIRLEMEGDIVDFISRVTPLGCPVVVTDGEGMRVNAWYVVCNDIRRDVVRM